jgi:hypothetical protein
VRIHTGANSQQAAGAVGARAYTIGQDIHFADGEYDPTGAAGLTLLAHEVAHTAQQSAGAPTRQNKLEVSSDSDASEVEADHAADAMVQGLPAVVTHNGGTTQRKLALKGKKLTPAQISALEVAKPLVVQAAACSVGAYQAIQGYITQGPPAIASVLASYNSTSRMYAVAKEAVELQIKKAKEIANTRSLVLNTLLDAAMAGISSKVTPLQNRFKAGNAEMKAAWSEFPSLPGGATTGSLGPDLGGGAAGFGAGKATGAVTGAAVGGAKTAVGLGGAPVGGDSVGGGPSQTAFLTKYAGLQAQAQAILPMALRLAQVNGPIGVVSQAIAGVLDSGLARSDYPVEKMTTDAAKIDSATRSLAAAAAKVSGMVAGLQDLAAQAAAAIPTSDSALQKELLEHWISGLKDGGSSDLMDEDSMEEFLIKRGVFKALGIELDGDLENDQETLAIVSAHAHAKVMAHKGLAVEVNIDDSGQVLGLVSLPGLPSLIPKAPTTKVRGKARAIVVGAHHLRTVTTQFLKSASHNKEALATKMLHEHFIGVDLKIYWGTTPVEEQHRPPPGADTGGAGMAMDGGAHPREDQHRPPPGADTSGSGMAMDPDYEGDSGPGYWAVNPDKDSDGEDYVWVDEP